MFFSLAPTLERIRQKKTRQVENLTGNNIATRFRYGIRLLLLLLFKMKCNMTFVLSLLKFNIP